MSQKQPKSSNHERYTFFVTCAPGVEPLLHRELDRLKLGRVERQHGGARFEGTMSDARRANLWLRTAVRVLLRLERFHAQTPEELYEKVHGIEWERWLRPEGRLIVDAQSRDSELNHTRFIEQKTKDAIVDRFRGQSGVRPSVDKEDFDLRVHVHVYRDRVTLSIDTSGDSLHKRGWRLHQGRAPLSETLASVCLLEADWDMRSPLLDPFCGSGTIAIEGALLALRMAPGLCREQFGFERWLDHDAKAWEAEKADALSKQLPKAKRRILGFDVDPDRVAEARENAASAGVDDLCEFEVADARDFAPRPGWNASIVTNPPYGERIGGDPEVLEALYEEFADQLLEHCGGYRLALLTLAQGPGRALSRKIRIQERLRMANGALDAELLMAEIPRP
ncbi:MAG: THUMP domain-containing protein [Planctomycetota bacterium]